ncbi:hypothetical protein CISIN_1g0324792mg, partial [Citrus sinensis]
FFDRYRSRRVPV